MAIQLPHHYVWEGNVGRWRALARLLPRRLRVVSGIDARVVQVAHRAGMAVHAWTIDDEEEMRELIGMGVDGIMTDRPSLLAAVLADGTGNATSRH